MNDSGLADWKALYTALYVATRKRLFTLDLTRPQAAESRSSMSQANVTSQKPCATLFGAVHFGPRTTSRGADGITVRCPASCCTEFRYHVMGIVVIRGRKGPRPSPERHSKRRRTNAGSSMAEPASVAELTSMFSELVQRSVLPGT